MGPYGRLASLIPLSQLWPRGVLGRSDAGHFRGGAHPSQVLGHVSCSVSLGWRVGSSGRGGPWRRGLRPPGSLALHEGQSAPWGRGEPGLPGASVYEGPSGPCNPVHAADRSLPGRSPRSGSAGRPATGVGTCSPTQALAGVCAGCAGPQASRERKKSHLETYGKLDLISYT